MTITSDCEYTSCSFSDEARLTMDVIVIDCGILAAVMHRSTETPKANTRCCSTIEAVAPSKHNLSAAGRTSVL